jgi:hypothetical protein
MLIKYYGVLQNYSITVKYCSVASQSTLSGGPVDLTTALGADHTENSLNVIFILIRGISERALIPERHIT